MAIRIERLKPIASQMLYSTGARQQHPSKTATPSLLCDTYPYRAALCISHNNSYLTYKFNNINRLAKFHPYAENRVIIFRAKLLILLNSYLVAAVSFGSDIMST